MAQNNRSNDLLEAVRNPSEFNSSSNLSTSNAQNRYDLDRQGIIPSASSDSYDETSTKPNGLANRFGSMLSAVAQYFRGNGNTGEAISETPNVEPSPTADSLVSPSALDQDPRTQAFVNIQSSLLGGDRSPSNFLGSGDSVPSRPAVGLRGVMPGERAASFIEPASIQMAGMETNPGNSVGGVNPDLSSEQSTDYSGETSQLLGAIAAENQPIATNREVSANKTAIAPTAPAQAAEIVPEPLGVSRNNDLQMFSGADSDSSPAMVDPQTGEIITDLDLNRMGQMGLLGKSDSDSSPEVVEAIAPEPVPDPVRAEPTVQPLVGIIDTGFSGSEANIDYNRVSLGWDRVGKDSDPFLKPGEGNEHGTHIMDTIAATMQEQSANGEPKPQTPMWLGRAVGSGEWANSLTEFVDAAKASGQPHAVANLSFDLTQQNLDGSISTRTALTPQEEAALQYARDNQVLVVVAAGNQNGEMSALGKASQQFDNVVSVGAVAGDSRASYASYGKGLDVVADGGTPENPVVAKQGDGKVAMAGTSVAAAKVTGAVAQIWAANPDLNYQQVADILQQSSKDLAETGWDAQTGYGAVDVEQAIALAKTTSGGLLKPQETSGEMPVLANMELMAESGAIAKERAAEFEFDFGGLDNFDFGGGLDIGIDPVDISVPEIPAIDPGLSAGGGGLTDPGNTATQNNDPGTTTITPTNNDPAANNPTVADTNNPATEPSNSGNNNPVVDPGNLGTQGNTEPTTTGDATLPSEPTTPSDGNNWYDPGATATDPNSSPDDTTGNSGGDLVVSLGPTNQPSNQPTANPNNPVANPATENPGDNSQPTNPVIDPNTQGTTNPAIAPTGNAADNNATDITLGDTIGDFVDFNNDPVQQDDHTPAIAPPQTPNNLDPAIANNNPAIDWLSGADLTTDGFLNNLPANPDSGAVDLIVDNDRIFDINSIFDSDRNPDLDYPDSGAGDIIVDGDRILDIYVGPANPVDDFFSDAPGDPAPIPTNNNTPDDFAIAFTPSTLANNNGDLVQLFGGDTSGNGVANTGNGGAIANNPLVIDGRPVSDPLAGIFPNSPDNKLTYNFAIDDKTTLVAGKSWQDLIPKPTPAIQKLIDVGNKAITPVTPTVGGATVNYSTGRGVLPATNPTADTKYNSTVKGAMPDNYRAVTPTIRPAPTVSTTPAAALSSGINTLLGNNFAGTGALANVNPASWSFTPDVTVRNPFSTWTQPVQQGLNNPVVQTAILNSVAGSDKNVFLSPTTQNKTDNPLSNPLAVPTLGSTAVLVGNGGTTSSLSNLIPTLTEWIGAAGSKVFLPVTAFSAAYFGNTQPVGVNSDKVPEGFFFNPNGSFNFFDKLGMGAAASIPSINPDNPLGQGIGNIIFNGSTLQRDPSTGTVVVTSPSTTNANPTFVTPNVALPTSPAANPAFGTPIETQPPSLTLSPDGTAIIVTPAGNLPGSPAANPAFAVPVEILPASTIGNNTSNTTLVGRDKEPFFTGSFSDPNSINYGKDAPVLPPNIEIFPNPSRPFFDPNSINFGQNPPVLDTRIEGFPNFPAEQPPKIEAFPDPSVGILGPQGHIFFSTANPNSPNGSNPLSQNPNSSQLDLNQILTNSGLPTNTLVNRGTLEHVMQGEINRSGNAVGFHYEVGGNLNQGARVISGTRSLPDSNGVYKGAVEVQGIAKTSNQGYSSFFPQSYSPEDVARAIDEAYNNRVSVPGKPPNFFRGQTSDGLTIEGYLQRGNIHTAYPIYQP